MLLNHSVFTCEKFIQSVFLGSFAPKMSIVKQVFDNKDEAIQVVNSKSKSSQEDL